MERRPTTDTTVVASKVGRSSTSYGPTAAVQRRFRLLRVRVQPRWLGRGRLHGPDDMSRAGPRPLHVEVGQLDPQPPRAQSRDPRLGKGLSCGMTDGEQPCGLHDHDTVRSGRPRVSATAKGYGSPV